MSSSVFSCSAIRTRLVRGAPMLAIECSPSSSGAFSARRVAVLRRRDSAIE
jgi:hypothetical protein